MKRRRLCRCSALVLCSWFAAFHLAAESDRGPSTPEERSKALVLVELLESRPMAPEAKDARQWLTIWLIEIPDITTRFCPAPLGLASDLNEYPPELVLQPAFSQAAYSIRNPDVESDSVEVYVAGVEGALRTYEAMRSAGAVPELRDFEELEKTRAAGKLEKAVRKRAKKCR